MNLGEAINFFVTDAIDFSVLVDQILVKIEGMEKGSEQIKFITDKGQQFAMLHLQNCCESVNVEDVVGDVEDLLNTPIVVAETRSEDGDTESFDTFTWTFYTLRTIKGTVTIRWYGTSNGYYSEDVDFRLLKEKV